MNFTVCKKLEDCVCKNCINWTQRKDNVSECRAQPTPTFNTSKAENGYWCSDGQWLCQFYGPSWVLKHEVLFRGQFIEYLFHNERDAQYREQKEKAREEFLAEARGRTTEEQLDGLFFKAELIFNDLYEIKKKLGMPLP